MGWTQADLDNLNAAIASGTKAVQYADKSITYQSVQEMLEVRALIEAAIAGISVSQQGRSTRVAFSRG